MPDSQNPRRFRSHLRTSETAGASLSETWLHPKVHDVLSWISVSMLALQIFCKVIATRVVRTGHLIGSRPASLNAACASGVFSSFRNARAASALGAPTTIAAV